MSFNFQVFNLSDFSEGPQIPIEDMGIQEILELIPKEEHLNIFKGFLEHVGLEAATDEQVKEWVTEAHMKLSASELDYLEKYGEVQDEINRLHDLLEEMEGKVDKLREMALGDLSKNQFLQITIWTLTQEALNKPFPGVSEIVKWTREAKLKKQRDLDGKTEF